MKKIKPMSNFGVASSIWCRMSDIKVNTADNEPIENVDDVDSKSITYRKTVESRFSHSFIGMSQNAVFCPVYQQQASHNFIVYTEEGQFSSEFINYLNKYDSLLFYGAEGMGCTTILKKLCNYVLHNNIANDKKYLPVYIPANWLFREIRKSNSNYRIDKYIDIVLNDWLGTNEGYKVSNLCKKNPILIILDDINDETDDTIFKWICENVNRKNTKIFISTNNSRIRTKFEKTFSTVLDGKVQYASIFLPLVNTNQCGQNFKTIEPSLNELLEMTPYFKSMLNYCQARDGVSFTEMSSVTSLINKYIGEDSLLIEGTRCAIEIFEGRQKQLEPNDKILHRGIIRKEGNIYEFENKILYYYFLAKQWYEALVADKLKCNEDDIRKTIESSMFLIKSKASNTSGAKLLHKYFISLSLDTLPKTLCLKDEEKKYIINFYKEELPLVLAESLRWSCNGNELYWKQGLTGLLDIINNPEKHFDVDIIDAERLLYQLGIGIRKNNDRPFLHYEEIPSNPNTLKFLLPREDFWVKLSTNNKIEVARFPVTVGEFSYFLDSGYFCAREQCEAQETFSEIDAKAAWDKIWGKNEYDINLVAQLMQKKWGLIHERLNNDIIIRLCKLYSDDTQIKQLYLFKELYDKNNIIAAGQSIKEGLEKIYSVDKLKYPMKWGDPLYSNPYYPIIGINYYEARAYCNWLSLMSQKKGEYKYRLLTRDEWKQMVKGVGAPKKEDIICNKDNQDDYLRIAFLSLLRNLDDELKFNDKNNSLDAYGNIFELVDTQFSKIQYGDGNMAHYYCFGGSYLQKYELAYDVQAKGPYEGQASSFQRNIDIGFRICRIR